MNVFQRDTRPIAVILAERTRAAARRPLKVTKPSVHLFDRPLPVAPKDAARYQP